ncbi:hypothetical protein OAU13_00550 [bacterium]|nr:hypothetical protein [bacterium]
MKKFSEAVLAPHKHMSKKASPTHAHSMGLVYTPSGKEEIRPIDTADAGYGGEAVADAEGGEADAGKASKKAVSPMKMQTLVKKTTNEETERERLKRLRSFAHQQKVKGLGDDVHEPVYEEAEQIDELKKSTLASYAKKAADEVSYHSFTAGTMSSKDPERLETDKKAMKRQRGVEKAIDKLAKEEVELDERNMENKAKKDNVTRQIGTAAYIQHGADAGSAKMTGRKVMSDPKMKSKKVADLYRKLPNIKEASSNGPEEENDMAMTQLHFIKYAAEEIMEAIKVGTDMEEWYQNKLTKAHMIMEGLHSYMEGRKRHYGSLGDPIAEGKAEVRADTHQAIKDFLAKGGVIKKFAPSKATHRPGTALASKMIGTAGQKPGLGRSIGGKKPVVAVEEGKMKDIATNKAEDERLAKLKAMAKKPKAAPVPRVGPMEKALEEQEVWDKPMPDSKKQGSLSPEQKAKAKARAERAGRSYPNMIDNMWASKQ